MRHDELFVATQVIVVEQIPHYLALVILPLRRSPKKTIKLRQYERFLYAMRAM
jgi:hypothetical protein